MSDPLPADLAVRALTAEDATATALVTAATDITYLEWMPEGWRPAGEARERAHYAATLSEPGRWSAGAFEGDGRLIAFATLSEATDDDGAAIEGMGHITDLFVHPSRWRQGIAAALLALAEEEMRRRRYSRGRLRAPVGSPAITFYESQGWSENGEANYTEMYDLHTIGFSKALESSAA